VNAPTPCSGSGGRAHPAAAATPLPNQFGGRPGVAKREPYFFPAASFFARGLSRNTSIAWPGR
jgi:hypothetical protein